MSTQISLQLPDTLFKKAKRKAKQLGYDTLQDFIRETVRKRLFEGEKMKGLLTYLASEKSLSKDWLKKEEDSAWKHLQKET